MDAGQPAGSSMPAAVPMAPGVSPISFPAMDRSVPSGPAADDNAGISTKEDALAYLREFLPQDAGSERRVVTTLLRAMLAERRGS